MGDEGFWDYDGDGALNDVEGVNYVQRFQAGTYQLQMPQR